MFASRGGFLYQPPASAGGFGNNAYFPNNVNQYLSVNSTTDLVNWKNTNGYTIEYWIYVNSFSSTINPGPGNQDTGGTNYWSFGPVQGALVEFYYWGSGQQFFKTATNTLTLNTWHNIAFVTTTSGSSTTASIYIDGIRRNIQWNNTGTFEQTKTVTNGITSASTPFRMGKYGSNTWNAYVDHLRVSNTARYSGASYTLATSPFTVDAQTQLYLTMDGTNGSTTFTDSSTFARAVTNNSNIVTISNARANHS